MGPPLLLLLLRLVFTLQLFTGPSPAAASSHISAVISQSGLDFAKDLLVSHAVETLTPLSVPDIEKSMSIPLVGTVSMTASEIVLHGLTVTNSTVAVGDTGVVVAASLASANLTMEWGYSYSAWFVTIYDCGNASIQRSSVEFDIDGLFISSDETAAPRDMLLGDIKSALPLASSSKMLWISLDEDVFNSVSALYFESVAVSGAAAVSGNNLGGRVELDYFSFALKWSQIGKLHTVLVQTMLRFFLKSLFVPYVNSYLEQGFPLPIINGFYITDAYILTSYSKMIVSCDVAFIVPETLYPVQTQGRFII
nr:unnamed protein product [Digitaria exilis]